MLVVPKAVADLSLERGALNDIVEKSYKDCREVRPRRIRHVGAWAEPQGSVPDSERQSLCLHFVERFNT